MLATVLTPRQLARQVGGSIKCDSGSTVVGASRLIAKASGTAPDGDVRLLLVFLNAYGNNPQAHSITVVAFHPEVFRVSFFSIGNGGSLLASSSKDNTRVELVKVELDFYGYRVYG
jgi:hypothetical protein